MVSELEREQIRQCMRALRDGLNGLPAEYERLKARAAADAVAHEGSNEAA